MKSFVTFLTLAVSSNAFIAQRHTPCCFHLSTTGAVTGSVGQLADGLLREGGSLSQAQFCISDGMIVDSQGRGCIVTPPTNVIQCDTGATGSSPFSIACDGTVSFKGSNVFFECQTGDNSEANVYAGSPGGINCGQITLHADGCMASCPSPTPTPPSPPVTPSCPPPTTVTVRSTVTVNNCPTAPSCPGTLSAAFEFPHLIIPIDSNNPNTAAGTSFFGSVTSTVSSIFNFDIPQSDAGHTCTLVFMLPTQAQLVTSSFTLSGSGAIDFSKLAAVSTQGTTLNNAPAVAVDYGVTTVSPGNSYNIAHFACPAGTAISFELKSSGGTSLRFFQDFNACPIGLFINVS